MLHIYWLVILNQESIFTTHHSHFWHGRWFHHNAQISHPAGYRHHVYAHVDKTQLYDADAWAWQAWYNRADPRHDWQA